MPWGGGEVLFELLNELEGLAEDTDLLVVLTTNRPDVVEPALAARPGRIDLALEDPLPQTPPGAGGCCTSMRARSRSPRTPSSNLWHGPRE